MLIIHSEKVSEKETRTTGVPEKYYKFARKQTCKSLSIILLENPLVVHSSTTY